RSMPLMVRASPQRARRPRPRCGLDQVFVQGFFVQGSFTKCLFVQVLLDAVTTQVPVQVLIGIGACSLDEQSDLARGARDLSSLRGGRPPLLVSRSEDFLAERDEQAVQIKSWMPVCHHALQFR